MDDNYDDMVSAFFDYYEKHNRKEGLELITHLNTLKHEYVLEIYKKQRRQKTLILKVKTEEAANLWRRGLEELQSYHARCKIAPVQP